MRYFLHIGYDGGKYRGWQRQINSVTVQETLENSLSKIFKEKITVYGCGRTDAGVHAAQYIMHINLKEELNFDLKFILSKNLKPGIAVFDVFKMGDRQHSRYDAIARTYEYFVHLHPDPILDGYSTYCEAESLDADLMQKATHLIATGSDFRHFCKQPDIHNHTLCKIESCVLKYNEVQGRLHLTITADRFLKSMIRLIIGTILRVGKKEMTIETVEAMLSLDGTFEYQKPALPNGLYLSKIEYPYLSIPQKPGMCSLLRLD